MTSNAKISTAPAALPGASTDVSKPALPTGPMPLLQQLHSAYLYLNTSVGELRKKYAELNRSIGATLATGTPRHGKPKLTLSMPDLAQHMEQRDARVKCQHLLLLLVPLKRLTGAALQQKHPENVKTSRQLSSLTPMLSMRCAGALPHAKDEVRYLSETFPELFGPVRPLAGNDLARKANSEKAIALHSKLLASGLLTAEELVTLRLVFAQYRA